VSDNELPDGWKRAPLGELADMCLGKMLDKNKNRGKLRPYLRNTNVRWYGFDLSDLLEMKFEDHEERRYSVSAGDVVVFEGGEPGRAAVWNRDDRPEMRFQKAVHRVRCGSFQRPWRLERQLEHYASTGDLAKHFTGTGIYHLTGRSLAQLPIALPPAEEQDSALEGIAKLEASRVVQTSRLSLMTTDLDTFKRSILAKAFRGELVEHEPGETTGGRSLAHTAKTPWRQGSPAEP
jgi:type I restriction enzyme S subunit